MPQHRISPAKAWCFTLNNYTHEEYGSLVLQFRTLAETKIDPVGFQFIIGKEVGESGTPHLQGYISMNKKFRPLPSFKVIRDDPEKGEVQCMHFERAKGSAMQNYRYCSKDGNYVSNMPKPYMNVEEAQKIWDEPDLEVPECEWACSKADYNKWLDQLERKEAAASVLKRHHDNEIHEQRLQLTL
ncbi:MAG: putative viral replication protein [Cressdnaviricota sp.]|nr:MAG: putative viral replication protein [Cressdnaviricota sp.]